MKKILLFGSILFTFSAYIFLCIYADAVNAWLQAS